MTTIIPLSLASAPTSVVFDKNKKYYAHSDLRRARDAENLQSSLRERERTCAQVHCVLQCDLCCSPNALNRTEPVRLFDVIGVCRNLDKLQTKQELLLW